MSSTPDTTDRRVGGLVRRRTAPDPANLIAANRPTAASVASSPPAPTQATPPRAEKPATTETEQVSVVADVQDQPARPRRQPSRPASASDPANSTSPEVDAATKVTVYLHQSTRDRAAVAFKATAYLEQDESWSHMVEKALLAEAERREAAHNGGRPFAADNAHLKRGRSVR